MFLTRQIQCSQLKNQFNWFDTKQIYKTISKCVICIKQAIPGSFLGLHQGKLGLHQWLVCSDWSGLDCNADPTIASYSPEASKELRENCNATCGCGVPHSVTAKYPMTGGCLVSLGGCVVPLVGALKGPLLILRIFGAKIAFLTKMTHWGISL